MGTVFVEATVENFYDLFEAEQGRRTAAEVRSIFVVDALIDTGATMLCMPLSMIQQLGLTKFRTRKARTAGGIREFGVYGMVMLTVQGREARVEVSEVDEGCPIMIGQIPLEILDFVVDLSGQRLIGNPAHGGEQMIEIYSYFGDEKP